MVCEHTLNPVIIDFWSLEIRWYGLMYVFAFLFVYLYVKKSVQQGKLNISLQEFDNLMVYLTIALVVGARLFEVLFYEFGYYASHPAEIIAIWKGGLSFHGGLFAMLLVAYFWCKNKKIELLVCHGELSFQMQKDSDIQHKYMN